MVNPMRDLPARLVAAVVRWMPAQRREWGSAMAAELAHVEGTAARWRFAAGCIRVALSTRGAWRGPSAWLAVTVGMVLHAPLALAPSSTSARLA